MARGKYADIAKLERREAVRRVVLQKLLKFRKLFGDEALGQALVASVCNTYTCDVKRWVQLGQGDLYTVLRGFGINIRISDRDVVVTDGGGTFQFRDDYYWSGLSFLLTDAGKALDIPFVSATVTKRPVSLIPAMQEAGFWDPSCPEASALCYLTDLHKKGAYDTTKLRLRMQGGSFTGLRPLVLNALKPVAYQPPAARRYTTKQRKAHIPTAYGVLATAMVDPHVITTPDAWAVKAVEALQLGITNRSREELNKHTTSHQASGFKKILRALPDFNDTGQFMKAFYIMATRDQGLTPLQTTSLFTRLHQYLRVQCEMRNYQ